MTTTYEPYLGSGQIYLKKAGSAFSPMPVGNASDLVFEYEEDNQKLPSYTKPGGGTHSAVYRVKSAKVSFKLYDLNTTNLTIATYGSSALVAGAPVLDEPGVAHKGGLMRFAHPGATAVTITNSAGTTTYAPNVDYEMSPAGARILTGGAITDGQSLLKDYTFPSYAKIETLTKGTETYEMLFEGFNEAKDGAPVLIDVWRMPLSPTKTLAMLSEGYAEIPMEGELLQDPTKVGSETSKYMRVTKI